ncbi:ORF3 [torque teno Delphinidae virus 29]
MAKTHLRNSIFSPLPRPREEWEARRQQAIRRLQQSSTGKLSPYHLQRRRGREGTSPSDMARSTPRSSPQRNPSAVPPSPPDSTPPVQTQYPVCGGPGLYIVSNETGPSAPREKSRARPQIRTPTRATEAAPKTDETPAHPPAPKRVRFRITMPQLPALLPPSKYPPIPLPYPMNIHK